MKVQGKQRRIILKVLGLDMGKLSCLHLCQTVFELADEELTFIVPQFPILQADNIFFTNWLLKKWSLSHLE